MPSRQQKRRAKRREEYIQSQDDELESSRVRYNADPENKRALLMTTTEQILKKCGHLLVTATEQILKKSGRLFVTATEQNLKKSGRLFVTATEQILKKKRTSVRDSYRADPEKKAGVCS